MLRRWLFSGVCSSGDPPRNSKIQVKIKTLQNHMMCLFCTSNTHKIICICIHICKHMYTYIYIYPCVLFASFLVSVVGCSCFVLSFYHSAYAAQSVMALGHRLVSALSQWAGRVLGFDFYRQPSPNQMAEVFHLDSVYIYIYICVCIYCIYTYICIERERERERDIYIYIYIYIYI